MKKKRIGMILDQKFPPDIRVENEAISLVNNGFEVHLFSFAFQNDPEQEVYKGINIYRVPASRYWIKKMRGLINVVPVYEKFLNKHICRFIEQNKIEILHVHDLYLLGVLLKIKKKYNIPLISDLHENYVEGLKHYGFANKFPGNLLINIKKWERKEREWLEKTDNIIVVIEEAIDRLTDIGIDPKKIVPVQNYLNISEYETHQIQPEIVNRFRGNFTVSYVGAFDYHRGLHILIKGFSKFTKQVPEAQLLLVGSGRNFDELKVLAKNLNIESKVTFTGYQPHEDLPSYIEGSTVGVIPHIRTGHTDNTVPHKLFNYMYKRKPVLVSDCVPLKRIVTECRCGKVFFDQNPDDLAKNLMWLYENKNNLISMGNNGYRFVVEKYNWDTAEKNLINLYERLLKQTDVSNIT